MLLGGNLGLLCSVVVVVVGWLVSRWKWRRVAARREEIKRLMAFASEETEMAELEAASGYRSYGWALVAEPVVEEPVIGLGSSPRRQLQYQCEMCFSPTTTRCKQCKAVHYCSRKCQIFHWRQGHKDECRLVAAHQSIDMGVRSCLKELKHDGIQRSRSEIQVMHDTRPVESSSRKRMFLNPNFFVLDENNGTETATEDDWKKPDMNVKSSVHLLDESSSSTISADMPVASDNNLKDGNKYDGLSDSMNMESSRHILSEKPSLANLEYSPAANQLKSRCIARDKKSESSISSDCCASDSEEHFSEPSTPSDFWVGTIEPKKSNINALEFDDVKMPNSHCPSLPSSGRINVRKEMLGSDMSRVQTNDPRPSMSMMPRKSIALSEVSEDGLKSKERLVLNCKLPGQNGITCTSTKCSPKEEAKLSFSNACHKRSSEEGHAPSKNVDNVCSLQPMAPKVLDHEVDGTNDLLNTLKIQRIDSLRRKSSEAHLHSSVSTKKTTVLDAQSVENGHTRADASCSLNGGGYLHVATSGTIPSARKVMDELRSSKFNRQSSLGAGSGIMGRYEGLFPYELFVKLYNWNKVELRPCGLKNCGNSCYANSVLQCLVFTPPLTAYFLQGLHAKTCHKKEWCITCEFEALVKKAKEGNYPLSPVRLMSQMQHVACHLGNGREEDAHEFLRYAIDAMQLVCLKDAGVNVPSSLDEDTTLLGLTFGGYLQSKIECMRCGGKSKQHERIMDLTIEIGGEIGSLEDALRQFTHSEILDGENKYRCSRCKSYEKAKKKLRVLEAPNVLTVALKRFQSGKFGKLNKSVKFPEILNLAPYMTGTSDKSPIYQLYGAVIHLDVKNATFTGHYVCYLKNNQGRWFKADDSLVQVVELEKVLSNDAYMLFYARCSPRSPRLIRSSSDPRKSNNKYRFHLTQPWDVALAKLNNGRMIFSSNSEDEYSTEYSSSFFSETGSRSTVSSNRESTSTDDVMFEHYTLGGGDMGNCWNNRTTTSDSDTPSPSSSLMSSPIRTRHSPLADADRYSSDTEIDGDGFWARTGNCNVMCGSNKEFSSCRNNNNNNSNVKGVYVGR